MNKSSHLFLKFVLFITSIASVFVVDAQKSGDTLASNRYLENTFNKVSVQKDIVFSEVSNFAGQTEKLKLDIYAPDGDQDISRPVIMWMHGGGFRPGNDKTQSYIVKMATDFALKGYICISIDYRIRNNPKEDKSGTMSNALEDAMSGLKWIRQHAAEYKIDLSKIVIGGGSAGGMLAVNFCFKDNTPSEKWDKSGIIALVDLWGSPEESYSFFKVDPNDPPTIIVHGTADSLVAYSNSEKLVRQLNDNHIKNKLITLKGLGHTPTTKMAEFTKEIATFLFEIVSPKSSSYHFNKRSRVGKQPDNSYVVPTTQKIEPAGNTITFPGRPVDLALSPDGKILAVKNLKDIVFFDVEGQKIRQNLALKEGGNTFNGICWSNNGTKVWITDTRGFLRSAKMESNGLFRWEDELLLPHKIFPDGKFGWENEVLDKTGRAVNGREYPGGLAIDETQGYIYLALNRNNSLGIINLNTKQFEGHIPVGIAPYAVLINGNKGYVSNWGGRVPQTGDKSSNSAGTQVVIDPKTGIASTGTVTVLDLKNRKVIREIKVRLHPSGMVLSPDGSKLYVANANSDIISVIDTKSDVVIKELDPKPMTGLPFGSAPNALAISADGNKLYVANGGNNLLAVIDLQTDKVIGLIPAGWYPGAVILDKEGKNLFVANIKGVGTRYLVPAAKGYKSSDHLGSVSFIPVPSPKELEAHTIKAAINMRLPEITQTLKLEQVNEKIVPVPLKPGEKSPIKHILYIIKENKTYDQVFGDLKQGNGDSTLCHLGKEVTPNHHALAENFVLLDNTYCNGVLSADGHQWTNEGYVTDYLEKSFGDFVRSYPYRGDDPLAFSSAGFIWDLVLKKGMTFRNYGEFNDSEVQPTKVTWSQVYDDFKSKTGKIVIRAIPKLHTLEPYNCPTFPGFTNKIPDVYRAQEFIKELKNYEKKGELPNLITMLLPNDHTNGVNENYPTPKAAVADNDLALGQIVDAISHTQFWKETAIFVIQDDPQSGLDHVDGKRTIALCISPYVKRGEVISTQYNQNSILRTIELILGLPPMTQLDLTAEPMTDCFTDKPDFTPYKVLPNKIPLDQINPKLSALKGKELFWARKSMNQSFDQADEIDDDVLNRIVWYATKGYDVKYPRVK